MTSFAELLKKERGDKSYWAVGKFVGVNYKTIERWEDGGVPRKVSISKVAKKFGWSDEVTSELMDWSEGELGHLSSMGITDKTKTNHLVEKAILAAKLRGLNITDLIDELDISKATFYSVRSNKSDMSERLKRKLNIIVDGDHVFNRSERGVLDIKLVQRIERKYGGLSHCPEDEPLLAELRDGLNIVLKGETVNA